MSDAGDVDEAGDSESSGANQPVEVIEIVSGEVDSEGNVIVDDALFMVDAEGTVVAKEETITFESPQGYTVVSSLGDDGEMHLIDPEVDRQDPDRPTDADEPGY